jgi:hypothetical protein
MNHGKRASAGVFALRELTLGAGGRLKSRQGGAARLSACGLGYERRFARLRGGDGESRSSSSRVNMKLMSTCQLSK